MKAGYDGIEMNFATCHLGNSFCLSAWNRRKDAYGPQSFENRATLRPRDQGGHQEEIGQDVPIGILINGAEYGIKDGLTLEETQEFAKIFDKAGFDYISVRVFGYMDYFDLHLPDSVFYPEPPEIMPKPLDLKHKGSGISVPVAAAIKSVVSIPVISVGKLDAVLGEKILEEGKVDFIGLARPLIADPEYPNKVARATMEDIRPCTYCLSCFGIRVDRHEDMTCRINGAVGGNQDYAVKPADKKKKVVVVGGGPGGMEAARVAAVRGHDVTLIEKDSKLGGLIPLAAMIKGLEVEELPKIINYYKVQFKKLGVKVKLGTRADAATIEQMKPDVVFVAVGGTPNYARHPRHQFQERAQRPRASQAGEGLPQLLRPRHAQVAHPILPPYRQEGRRHRRPAPGRRGHRVPGQAGPPGYLDGHLLDPWSTSVSPMPGPCASSAGFPGRTLTTFTDVKYDQITDKGLTITTKDGQKQTIEADSIIPVIPWATNMDLANSLKGKVPEVYAIGDCKEAGLIIDAVGQAFSIARNL